MILSPPRPRLVLLLALVLCQAAPATVAAKRRAAAPRTPALLRVPVRFMVARCPEEGPAGGPAPASQAAAVRPREWLQEHLRAAAALLGPHGITLDPTFEEFTPETCDLVGREQRDAVARFVRMDGRATVLVVRRVPDLAVHDHDLMGVQWAYRGDDPALRRRTYVLLTAKARPNVLAHELGHYFGLPHDRRGGTLMTPGPSDPAWRRRRRRPKLFQPVLRPAQVQRLRAGIAAFLRRSPAASQPAQALQRR